MPPVGAEPPELRASDADRERTALALRDAAVEGRLTLEELSTRLDRAYAAQTRGELDAVAHDLPAPQPVRPQRRPRRFAIGIMGGSNLRGRFRIEQRLLALSVMGGSNIDLRQAEIPGDEVTLTCLSVMGGTNIVVPEGVDVDVTGFAVMGGKNVHVRDVPARPGTPLVRIQVLAVMGGVNVRSRPAKRPQLQA